MRNPALMGGAGWSLRVVPNRIPLLRVEAKVPGPEVPGRRVEGLGAHEVVIETPNHSLKLSEYTASQLADVLRAWRDRIRDLLNDGRLHSFVIHRAEGENRLEHPHSQLFAFPALPGLPVWHPGQFTEMDPMRTVARCGRFVAYMEYAQEYPFETRIRSTVDGDWFGDGDDLKDLAVLIRDVWRRIELALLYPPIRLAFRVARGSVHGASGWDISLRPCLQIFVPLAWEAGIPINPVPPEEGAETLRKLSDTADMPSPDYLLESRPSA